LVEEINNFFAEIVLRQMNHEEEKASTQAEGSGPAEGTQPHVPEGAPAEGGDQQPPAEPVEAEGAVQEKFLFGKRILVDLQRSREYAIFPRN
jgi:hypothetical protein